jgi:hypothetical protein
MAAGRVLTQNPRVFDPTGAGSGADLAPRVRGFGDPKRGGAGRVRVSVVTHGYPLGTRICLCRVKKALQVLAHLTLCNLKYVYVYICTHRQSLTGISFPSHDVSAFRISIDSANCSSTAVFRRCRPLLRRTPAEHYAICGSVPCRRLVHDVPSTVSMAA